MEFGLDYIIIIIISLLASTISGTIGMGGGILLLAGMTPFFPPQILIPLHGVAQLGSNATRTVIHYKNINWKMMTLFGIGALLGASIGSQFLIQIPENIYKIFMGLMIVGLTWMPKIKKSIIIPGKFFIIGSIATFLSLFVGATGPLIAPFFLKEKLSKEGIVATKAACQLFTHTFKIVTFVLIGFSFGPYWKLLIGMLIAVFIGNNLGKYLLGKISENKFRVAFKIVISLLSLRMIYSGLISVV